MLRGAVFVYPLFAELQVAPALDLLRGHAHIVVLAHDLEPVRSEGGLRVLPDARFDQVLAQPFDLLVVPGAVDMEHALKDAALHEALRDLAPRAGLLAAICAGPMVLAKADVLNGRRWTTNFTAAQRRFVGVAEDGFVEEELVEDRGLITARAHMHGRFALAIAARLGIEGESLRRYVLGGQS